MKMVQDALKGVVESGIPVVEGIWRTESKSQNPPAQYAVYSAAIHELDHWDDGVHSYYTIVYLNLWSKTDVTTARNAIRKAMYDAGFSLQRETTLGYNQPAYDHYTHQYTVQWQWKIATEEMP